MNNYKREIAQSLRQRVNLRRVPKLVFKIDHSRENVERINEILEILDNGDNLPLE